MKKSKCFGQGRMNVIMVLLLWFFEFRSEPSEVNSVRSLSVSGVCSEWVHHVRYLQAGSKSMHGLSTVEVLQQFLAGTHSPQPPHSATALAALPFLIPKVGCYSMNPRQSRSQKNERTPYLSSPSGSQSRIQLEFTDLDCGVSTRLVFANTRQYDSPAPISGFYPRLNMSIHLVFPPTPLSSSLLFVSRSALSHGQRFFEYYFFPLLFIPNQSFPYFSTRTSPPSLLYLFCFFPSTLFFIHSTLFLANRSLSTDSVVVVP